ncbi:MAG: RidA family protein [Candidatus Bathyarchaeia archaeon]
MKKEILKLKDLPKPIYPGYTAATKFGNLVFLAGQLATDLRTNQPMRVSIEEQAEIIFARMKKALKACGSSIENILKITIFVKDLNDFPKVAKVREKYLGKNPPASTAVQITKLVYDLDVEIEAIATI